MTTRKAKVPVPPASASTSTTVLPSAPALTGVDAAAASAEPILEITFRGPAGAVRSAVHNARFDSPWGIGLARGISLDQTLVPDALLDDTLDGEKIRMFAQDDRDIYRVRCCQAADKLGHTVPQRKQSLIKVDAGSTIRDVAQALYDNAN